MSARTFVVGDVHGDLEALRALLGKLPSITAEDSVVFLGDYVDRGPRSREVVRVVRALDQQIGCNVICLRGNHEDGWLRAIDEGWPEFVVPPPNGCLAAYLSYWEAEHGDAPADLSDADVLLRGRFFPDDVVAWMRTLPYFHEDAHAIYVHAGLLEREGAFLHPKDTEPRMALLWTRSQRFFRDYRGKRVVVGHTATELLPPELSQHTPEDPADMWAGECVVAIDTGAGKGGFLTALELPSLRVYESR